MRQQEVFNKVGSILNELNEQYEYLKKLPTPLDDLELELFTANANFLGDHLEILRKLNTGSEKSTVSLEEEPFNAPHINNKTTPYAEIPSPTLSAELPAEENLEIKFHQDSNDQIPDFEFDLTHTDDVAKPVSAEVPPILVDDIAYLEDEPVEHVSENPLPDFNTKEDPVPHIDLNSDKEDDHFSFIRSTEPNVIRHSLELDEADTFSETENAIHEETVAEALAKKEVTSEISNKDEVKEDNDTAPAEEKPLTLNERISAQISGHQHPANAQPVTDLKAAITLNDKMLFVRDLFNGYSLAYSEAIEILNRFNKLEDASRFLAVNYEAKNNWADKPATREKFYDLLQRRFS